MVVRVILVIEFDNVVIVVGAIEKNDIFRGNSEGFIRMALATLSNFLWLNMIYTSRALHAISAAPPALVNRTCGER